jgi:hypothetical protein
VVAGLLAWQEARGTSDPTMAAERCLNTVALAVSLASADLD